MFERTAKTQRVSRVRSKAWSLLVLMADQDGRRTALAEVRRFAWSDDETIVMRRDQTLVHPAVQAKIRFTVRRIGSAELRRVFETAPPADAVNELERKRRIELVDAGAAQCWLAETLDGRPCHLDLFVGPAEMASFMRHTRGVFPSVAEDAGFAEGAYTLEPFRGLHLQGAVASVVYETTCGPEINAIYAHVAPDSRTLRANRRLGYEPHLRQFERYRLGRLSVSRERLYKA